MEGDFLQAYEKCVRVHRFVRVMSRRLFLSEADEDEFKSAAALSALECWRDGHLHPDGSLTKGGYRYITRQIIASRNPLQASGEAEGLFDASGSKLAVIYEMPKPTIDYGYEDGRVVRYGEKYLIKGEGRDKYARRRNKCRTLGLCPICGKPPEGKYKLCLPCRTKRRTLNLRSHYRNQAGDHRTAIFLGAMKLATCGGTTTNSPGETPTTSPGSSSS